MQDKTKYITTNAEIERIKPIQTIQKYPIGKGLYLEVTPNGSKIFRAQFTRSNQKPFKVLITIGRYPEIKIKQAVDLADTERLNFKKEKPIESKNTSGTFRELSEEWYKLMIKAEKWGEVNATDVLGNLKEACDGRNGGDYGFGDVQITEHIPLIFW